MEKCRKCNKGVLVGKEEDTRYKVYCSKCGKFHKWGNKSDRNIYPIANEVTRENIVAGKIMVLSDYSTEELLQEVMRRLK